MCVSSFETTYVVHKAVPIDLVTEDQVLRQRHILVRVNVDLAEDLAHLSHGERLLHGNGTGNTKERLSK